MDDNEILSNIAEGPKINKKPENKLNDIDGQSLSYPYIFQKRMEDRAKTLFASFKDDKYDTYSRMCPSNIRRQPVILSEEEVNDIKQKYPSYLKEEEGDLIKYSSNPTSETDKESYYYACPRYWCLLTDSVISEEDVALKKCGEVLDKNAKKVTPGHYVYEFSHEKEHIGPNGEYIKHFPGFHKDNTKDGKCIPCCYKNWDTNKQIERRKTCGDIKDDSNSIISSDSSVDIVDSMPEDQYIIGAEKFPLPAGRWGYLPISIQKFFHDVGFECNIGKKSGKKSKSTCLLRQGVEKSDNKSFLACISNALFYAEYEDVELQPILSIIKNKKKQNQTIIDLIIQSITIDSFMTYQNATLVDSFYEEDSKTDDEINDSFQSLSISYNTSKIYNKSKIGNQRFFMKVLNAFSNFVNYLSDEKSFVDYTYLWDIICIPNPLLFKNGVNLVILNIPENDSTNNIDFVCPTTHYSSNIFESRKKTLFIICRDNYYEPIYEYRDTQKKVMINKFFSEYDPHLPKNIRSLFIKIIKPIIHDRCSEKPSTNTYHFNKPILLDTLIKMTNTKKYLIKYQVLNLQGKVIGIVATDTKDINGFLPCYPSAVDSKYDYDYIYVTDESKIWNTYRNTLLFLNRWYKIKHSSKKEPQNLTCSSKDAFCKVVEDGMIVGFLTNTNQFIQITEPHPNIIHDNLHVVTNDNYLIADYSINKNTKVDDKRVNYINKIKLEYNFYNVFRNTVKILLNEYSNLSKQNEIKHEINKQFLLYNNKLLLVVRLLKELVLQKIIFNDEIDFNSLKEITTCVVYEENKCNENNPICFYNGDGCVLNIPKYNLITNIDNEEFYYTRLADELIRYSRIKSFIFQKKTYLSFDKIGYNLNNNEIIMLQSLITQDYFSRLIATTTNNYIKNNNYDTANPIYGQKYNNSFTLNDIIQPMENETIIPKTQNILSVFWRECFPKDCIEVVYPENNSATFHFIIDIIGKVKNIVLTDGNIRDELTELYLVYEEKYKIQISNILIAQGKKSLGDQLKSGTLQLKHLFYSESYYLTNFDLWLLLDKYQIPSFFISPRNLLETGYNHKSFLLYTENTNIGDSQPFVFIISPSIKAEISPSYRIIQNGENLLINLEVLNDNCFLEVQNAIDSQDTILHFISVFKLPDTTKYMKKQKGIHANPINIEVYEPTIQEMSEIVPDIPIQNIQPLNELAFINKDELVEFIPGPKIKNKTKKIIAKQQKQVIKKNKKQSKKQKSSNSSNSSNSSIT